MKSVSIWNKYLKKEAEQNSFWLRRISILVLTNSRIRHYERNRRKNRAHSRSSLHLACQNHQRNQVYTDNVWNYLNNWIKSTDRLFSRRSLYSAYPHTLLPSKAASPHKGNRRRGYAVLLRATQGFTGPKGPKGLKVGARDPVPSAWRA